MPPDGAPGARADGAGAPPDGVPGAPPAGLAGDRPGSPARLPPAAARTLYNAADALRPPGVDARGGGDVDLAPAVARALVGPRERRALVRALAALERAPRLRLESLSGYSWLPRERRREILEAWARSALPWRRWRAARIARAVEAGLGGGAHSLPGA